MGATDATAAPPAPSRRPRLLAASSRGRRLGAGGAAVASVAPIDSRLITFDELLHQPLGLVVAVLHRRRLHGVRARTLERTADAAVERQLGAAHGVDDDAGRVGRVD